ncbi:MAG TPA: hypothetical protein PKD78_01835, partial [Saprospiraceae bacterium]|nr:hypothetical protein [Saprospiraceae bacterium]
MRLQKGLSKQTRPWAVRRSLENLLFLLHFCPEKGSFVENEGAEAWHAIQQTPFSVLLYRYNPPHFCTIKENKRRQTTRKRQRDGMMGCPLFRTLFMRLYTGNRR